MTMLHDVLRFLVRRVGGTPAGQLRVLAMIDGDEAGFQTIAAYERHLGRRLPAEPQPGHALAQVDSDGYLDGPEPRMSVRAKCQCGWLSDTVTNTPMIARSAVIQAHGIHAGHPDEEASHA